MTTEDNNEVVEEKKPRKKKSPYAAIQGKTHDSIKGVNMEADSLRVWSFRIKEESSWKDYKVVAESGKIALKISGFSEQTHNISSMSSEPFSEE